MKKITIAAIFLLTVVPIFAQRNVKQRNEQPREVQVEIVTTMGNVVVSLFNDTPKHRDNFLNLVREHFYDKTLFHRVIKDFMVQAGDPDSREAKPGQMLGSGSVGDLLEAEILPTHFHRRGALCAARRGDRVNPERRSSPNQFYIVQGHKWTVEELQTLSQKMGKQIPKERIVVYTQEGGTPHLDDEYTVFGQVIEGMDVIDAIAKVKTDSHDRPITDVRIIAMHIR